MIRAPTIAPTIPTPASIVLIRVLTDSYTGFKPDALNWQIMGPQDEVEFEYRWDYGKDLVLGYQGPGEYILDVSDLGLDPKLCISYLEDTTAIIDLYREEDDFNLHSNPNGECLCSKIDAIRMHREPLRQVITIAVKDRYDAWTRRRHLVAFALAAEMLSAPAHLLDTAFPSLPEPIECESPTLPPIALTPSDWFLQP